METLNLQTLVSETGQALMVDLCISRIAMHGFHVAAIELQLISDA